MVAAANHVSLHIPHCSIELGFGEPRHHLAVNDDKAPCPLPMP